MNVLITGGTGGIGKEIARGLAKRGARVLVVGHDFSNGDAAIRELPGGVEFLQTDLTSGAGRLWELSADMVAAASHGGLHGACVKIKT